jgi:hypothetical protein
MGIQPHTWLSVGRRLGGLCPAACGAGQVIFMLFDVTNPLSATLIYGILLASGDFGVEKWALPTFRLIST